MKYVILIACLFPFATSAQRAQHTNVVEYNDNIPSFKHLSAADTFTYNGNFFQVSAQRIDTITVIDPVTGKEQVTLVDAEVYPARMNNDTIYNIATDSIGSTKKALHDVLLSITNSIRSDLEKLDDGFCQLDVYTIVIDDKGRLVYTDRNECSATPNNPMTSEMKKEIEKELSELFATQKAWPVYRVNGKPVVYTASYHQTVYLYQHHSRL